MQRDLSSADRARSHRSRRSLAAKAPVIPSDVAVAHINLARGYRGGERQTQLLIQELAARGLSQRAIVRRACPLARQLAAALPDLSLQEVSSRFAGAGACRGAALVHAHEAHGATSAWLGHVRFGVPYLVTRRVDNPIRARGFGARAHRSARCVAVLSKAIEREVARVDPAINTVVIPSAHSSLSVDSRLRLELDDRYRGKFVVCHVGALVAKHKGQETLLDAARLLADRKDLVWLLLGSGRDELDLKARARDLDRVEFIGQVSEVGTYLDRADLFVFPSLMEGLGSSLLDAMAYGLPIVATRVGGIPDIVGPDNGLLVPPDDPEALASAVAQLCEDPRLCNAMAEANRRKAYAYSAEAMAQRYAALYDRLVQQEGG